jgi:hypothetical protein
MRENSLSTVFLPSSVTPLHEVEALGRPPVQTIRLRYEEKGERQDNDWKPFVEVECDVYTGSEEKGISGSVIKGWSGREKVQYVIRPAR